MKTILAVLLIIANQAAVYFEAKSDAAQQKRGETVDHVWSSVFRCTAWALLSVCLNQSAIAFGLIMYSVEFFFVLGFTYWLTFDYWYNRFAGNNWYYTSKGPMDSILSGYDNRFKRLALKIMMVTMFIFIYFITNRNG